MTTAAEREARRIEEKRVSIAAKRVWFAIEVKDATEFGRVICIWVMRNLVRPLWAQAAELEIADGDRRKRGPGAINKEVLCIDALADDSGVDQVLECLRTCCYPSGYVSEVSPSGFDFIDAFANMHYHLESARDGCNCLTRLDDVAAVVEMVHRLYQAHNFAEKKVSHNTGRECRAALARAWVAGGGDLSPMVVPDWRERMGDKTDPYAVGEWLRKTALGELAERARYPLFSASGFLDLLALAANEAADDGRETKQPA